MKKYYYTIGEVCNLLNLKAHVLRYWEKEFKQLQPRKIKGRNRKYSPDDIELIKQIKYMLYEQKFTIDGARKELNRLRTGKKQIDIDFKVDKEQLKKEIIKTLKNLKKTLESI